MKHFPASGGPPSSCRAGEQGARQHQGGESPDGTASLPEGRGSCVLQGAREGASASDGSLAEPGKG